MIKLQFFFWQNKLFLCASIFELKTLFLLLLFQCSAFLIPPWRPVWRLHVPMFHNKLCCRKKGIWSRSWSERTKERIFHFSYSRERMKMRADALEWIKLWQEFSISFSITKSPASAPRSLLHFDFVSFHWSWLTVFDYSRNDYPLPHRCRLLPPGGNLIKIAFEAGKKSKNKFYVGKIQNKLN